MSNAARSIFGAANAFSFTNLSVEGQAAQNAIDVATVGLYIAAGVAILTALVGIGIALSREIALGDAQQLTLSALGMRPRHRVAAAAAIALPIAAVGAVLAVVGAVLASPIFPIGVAGKAEPDPGIRLDGVTVGVGFVAVVVVVLVIALLAGLRTARATGPVQEASRPGVAARIAQQSGTRPPVAVGVRFALDPGHQSRALPVRSSLFGAAFGVVVVVAVLVFSAGLDHLIATPAEFGWTWDLTAYDTKAAATARRLLVPHDALHPRGRHHRRRVGVQRQCRGCRSSGHGMGVLRDPRQHRTGGRDRPGTEDRRRGRARREDPRCRAPLGR